MNLKISATYGISVLLFISMESIGQTFALSNTVTFANQDTNTGEVTISEDGTLMLKGNRWQATQNVFTITPKTVLEFEFASDREGEIHGIGFSEENSINASRIFQLAGIQRWGQQNVADYSKTSGEFQKFKINVGEFYTGENMRLVLVNDNDVPNPLNTSYYRNLSVTESETSLTPEATPESESPLSTNCMTPTQQALLDAHNAARSTGHQCGTVFMPAVPTLTWSCTLSQAATNHSVDMATNNFFSHTGSDGLSSFARISNLGYDFRAAGENIAAGQNSVNSVINSWLSSPGHCQNIMNASYTEFGAALIENQNSSFRLYWTSDFAAPL